MPRPRPTLDSRRTPRPLGPAVDAFDAAAQRAWLRPVVFLRLRAAAAAGRPLDPVFADLVADGIRAWGASRGATHVAYAVQPLTGPGLEHRSELAELTGGALLHGALPGRPERITWDPASAPYVRMDAAGATVWLPGMVAGPDGEALDHRLPLQRSLDALSTASVRALRAFGLGDVRRVNSTVARTHRFTLVDQEPQHLRSAAGRRRACELELERELARVGVLACVRAADGAHVLALPPASAGVAADRHTLALSVLADTARRYGFVVSEDARPDGGLWSLTTPDGANLLAPGVTPATHLRFLFFASAVLRAFESHPELVQAAVGPRLDLGPELEPILDALARGEIVAGSDEEREAGAPTLPAVPARTVAEGYTGAGLALTRLDPLSVTFLNVVVADAIAEQTRALETWASVGEDFEPAVREVVAHTYRRYRRARSARRPGGHGRPETLLMAATTTRLFAEHGVLSARELEARHDVRADLAEAVPPLLAAAQRLTN